MDDGFAARWHDAITSLTFPEDSGEEYCAYAQCFQAWVEELQKKILDAAATAVAINQAKILLLDRYFSWRNDVPKLHRNAMHGRSHRCIWHVFEDGYKQLEAARLAIEPPQLALPPIVSRERRPRVPKPPVPQIAGLAPEPDIEPDPASQSVVSTTVAAR